MAAKAACVAAKTALGIGMKYATKICMKLPLCYDDETSIETMSGIKKVRDIDQGDHVLTLKDGKEHWSEVTLNMNIPVAAAGLVVEAYDSSGEAFNFHVTKSHTLPFIKASEEFLVKDKVLRGINGKNTFAHLAKVVTASDLEIGDLIQIMSPSKKEVSLAKITSLKSMSLKSKNMLHTADGTVLSNGVLTATSCDISMKNISLKEYMENVIKEDSFNQCMENLGENMNETFSKAAILGLDNGQVYASDLFEYIIKHCSGTVDIIPVLVKDYDLHVSPTDKDKVALLHMALKEELKMFDANGDGVIDYTEYPLLDEGENVTAVDLNPYLCKMCSQPIDTEKILKSSKEENKIA